MIFKIYNCDFGVKVNGQNYDFLNVSSLAIDDPEKNRLVRGSNAKDTTGIAYREGVKDAKKWTVQIMGMTADLKSLFDGLFENQTRCDAYAIDRTDGSSKMARNSVLCSRPQQLKLDDSPEAMDVQLEFETYDSKEDHKS